MHTVKSVHDGVFKEVAQMSLEKLKPTMKVEK